MQTPKAKSLLFSTESRNRATGMEDTSKRQDRIIRLRMAETENRTQSVRKQHACQDERNCVSVAHDMSGLDSR